MTLQKLADQMNDKKTQCNCELNEDSYVMSIASHELNNLLAGIQGYNQIATQKAKKPDVDISKYLQKIQALCERMGKTIKSVSSYAKNNTNAKAKKIEAQELINRSLDVFAKELKDLDVEVRVQVGAKAKGETKTDAHSTPLLINEDAQIAFSAFIKNTLEAIKENKPTNPFIQFEIDKENTHGNQIKITYKDNAGGIAPDTLKRVFEPFFTTKDNLSNHGLGLSVARKVFSALEGSLSVESDAGAVITCLIPAD